MWYNYVHMNIREIAKKTLFISLPVFSSLFLVGATGIIILLMKGYSIDITKRELIKTGVLNLETAPAEADITIDGAYHGKTNKAIPNLKVGTYSVELSREGYFPYARTLPVNHGLATPLSVPMVRKIESKVIINETEYRSYQQYKNGYLVLSQLPMASATASPTGTVSITPSPTTTPVPGSTSVSYTITNITVTKPFFEDPQPALDEKMTVTTTYSNQIADFSVSPTGKFILVTTLNSVTKTKALSLVPFKKGTTISLSLTENKTLSYYAQEKNTTISWSQDGDYVIIETNSQIISYNVKSGTKIILYEKGESTGAPKVIWNKTPTGIAVLRKVQGSLTETYELLTISNNSNPVTSQIPLLNLEEPTSIWDISTTSPSLFIIATKKGSYLFGQLYDQKTGDLEITLTSTEIAGSPVQQLNDDFSLITLTNTEITEKPEILIKKYAVVFLAPDKKSIQLFTYNKKTSDTITSLGKSIMYASDMPLTIENTFADDFYIGFTQEGKFFCTDNTGKNIYELTNSYKNSNFGQNDSALLFTDKSGNILFRVIR